MSTTRKSPTESATLYKVGTKKIGNDGNKWIIVENKNNVKKWQKYKRRIKDSFKEEEKKTSVKPIKKRVSKKILLKNVKTTDFYDLPKMKKNNWNKWLENLTSDQKKYVDKVRNSYKSIEKETDIIVIEVILPVSNGGYYFIDYIWDYAKELHPSILDDDKAYLMVTFKLTQDMHLFLDSKNHITVQHKGVLNTYKKNLLEYIEKFNKEKNGKIKWNKTQLKAIEFYL